MSNDTNLLESAEFATAIGEAVAAGIAKNTPKKVTFGQYIRGNHSPFNLRRLKLTRVCAQNGVQITAADLHSDEIELLNKITHSGRYIDRMVEVIVNNDNAEETVEIRFANRTADQRFELKDKTRNFVDMLRQITAAQDIENEDAAAQNDIKAEASAKRRVFGENKASKEAREKAGV